MPPVRVIEEIRRYRQDSMISMEMIPGANMCCVLFSDLQAHNSSNFPTPRAVGGAAVYVFCRQ